MIASMDKDWDFVIFLNNEELILLKKRQLEGTVVKLHKPYIQEPFKLSINNNNHYARASGLALIEFKKEYIFETSEITYKFLKNNNRFCARYHGGLNGSKFKLINIEKTKDYWDKQAFENIKFYIENQEKIKKDSALKTSTRYARTEQSNLH